MAVHSPVNGTTAIPWRASKKKPSLLERLRWCEEAWCPKEQWSKEKAHAAIRETPPGTFLVLRDSVTFEPTVLCVSTTDQHEPVTEWYLQSSDKAVQLFGSQLSFSDVPQLVFFYSFTRDVLPVCLSVPHWVFNVTENDCPSQLDPKMWLNADSEEHPEKGTNKRPNSLMCSIQLTSSNGALCVINPLYIHEHGDEWLTHQAPRVQSTILSTSHRRDRRMSTARPWSGAALGNKRTVSLEQEFPSAIDDSTGLVRVRSADSKPITSAPTATLSGVVLRRPSRDAPCPMSLPPSPAPLDDHHSSPAPQSPHRVSWIEDGVWLPPPRPASFLILPSLELDSLSISSIEEEQDLQTPTTCPLTSSPHRLADKVKNRLSAVGQALGGMVCPKKRLNNRVQEMSERRGGEFADTVKGFVEMFLQKNPEKEGLTEFLQEVRSSLTSLRETLLDHPEIQVLLDGMTEISDAEIDSLLERSLHKVALKPLSCHLYGCIQTSRSGDGTLDHLVSNQPRLEPSSVEQLGGSAGVGVPDSATLERIQEKWEVMHKAYSPNQKVLILLKVCKSIYHSMSANSNNTAAQVFGADDFLPCLTWVLLRSDVITLQVDIDYMMELLDPTQLQGEGGYYLTTMYASLFYISSYKPRLAARQLSVEAQKSLNQWHRRRTMHSDRPRRSKLRQTIRRQSHRGQRAEDVPQDTGPATVDGCDEDGRKEIKKEVETLEEVNEDSERNGLSDEDSGKEMKKEAETLKEVNEENEKNKLSDEEEKAVMRTETQNSKPVRQQDTRTDTSADIQR